MPIDLHTHTDRSDGTVSPAALIEAAAAAGLSAIAITDHDTLDGYDAAAVHAQRAGVRLLCGIELGTRLEGAARSAHLLAYFGEDPGEAFRAWLLRLQASRRERNNALFERLRELGVHLDRNAIEQNAPGQLGRPQIARALVAHGYARDIGEAFDVYLSEHGSAWTEREEPVTAEAIRRVKQAGGVTSLAHPVRLARGTVAMLAVAVQLRAAGLDAVECFHPEIPVAQRAELAAMAAEHALLATGGSDYHGDNKPDIRLGRGRGDLQVPAAILPALEKRLAAAGGGA